jgi:hypothetical protein
MLPPKPKIEPRMPAPGIDFNSFFRYTIESIKLAVEVAAFSIDRPRVSTDLSPDNDCNAPIRDLPIVSDAFSEAIDSLPI